MIYEDSMALSACPGLKGRINTNCAAVCAPVTISGHGAGMIRAIGESKSSGLHPMLEMVQSVSFHLGMRLATLRSMASSERAASTDPLTGLANRRTMERQVEALSRRGQLFSVVIVDIDHFKKLNDTHGHETGDKAIKAVASLLRRSIREQDLVCRFGGEEFVFILPGFAAEEALGVYNRIQRDLPGALQRSSLPLFTLSAGVADHSHGGDFESILCLADQALYQAKNSGRNRAVQAGTEAGAWPPV
jgi:diguanylate cyclase (GGDEF)-like protein